MLQCRVIEFVDAAAREHDGIDPTATEQRRLPMPETFPDHAFDAIALNCAAYVFLSDNKPEPRVIETIITGENQ